MLIWMKWFTLNFHLCLSYCVILCKNIHLLLNLLAWWRCNLLFLKHKWWLRVVNLNPWWKVLRTGVIRKVHVIRMITLKHFQTLVLTQRVCAIWECALSQWWELLINRNCSCSIGLLLPDLHDHGCLQWSACCERLIRRCLSCV